MFILKKVSLILAFVIFNFSTSDAVSQSQDYIKALWSTEQATTILQTKTDVYYTGQEGTKNYYAHFDFPENQKGATLLIITGLEDPVPLWFDTVLKAKEYGFKNVYIVELRGQGQSQRIPSNKEQLIHIESFENYYLDLVSALKDINSKTGFAKTVHTISHSTGSLVLGNSLKLIKTKLPKLRFGAFAFWTPLVSLKLSPLINNAFVRPIISIVEKLYRTCCGIMVAKKYFPQAFEENRLTTSPDKFKTYESLCYEYKLGSSGVSIRWVLESIKASQEFKNLHLNQIDIPTLILKAEDDLIVKNNFSYQNKNISTYTINGAKHALNIEQDHLFNDVLKKTFAFFQMHSPKTPN